MDLFRGRRYTSRKSSTSGASCGVYAWARAKSSNASQLQSRVESTTVPPCPPTWTGAGQKQQERKRTKVVVGGKKGFGNYFLSHFFFLFHKFQRRNLCYYHARCNNSNFIFHDGPCWKIEEDYLFFLLPRGFCVLWVFFQIF